MHEADIERSQGKQAFMLGSGINTLTMQMKPPAISVVLGEKPATPTDVKSSTADKTDTSIKVDQTPRETEIITIGGRKIESNINVFTSLLGLQQSISGSLGLPIANAVSITEQLSSSTQSTVNDIFVMLKMRCIEKTVALSGNYHLKPAVESRLKSADFADLRQEFGDSVISSITYGRSTLVLIRFHLNSIADQVSLSTTLSTSGPAVINGSMSATLQKSLASKSYSSYILLEGMEDQSAGLFSSEADISTFIAKLVVNSESKIQPIPLSISYIPFSTSIVSESLLKRARKFEQSVFEARKLYLQVRDAQGCIDGYLHSFYALDNPDLSTIDLRTQCIDTLQAFRANFNRIGALLDTHACNNEVLDVLSLEINVLIEELRCAQYAFPEAFNLPIKQVLVDAIQNIKHHHSEYEFHLNVPAEASTLRFVIESAEQKQHRLYVLMAQMLDKVFAQYLVATDLGIEFITHENVAAFAKMKLELSLSMLLLRRIEQTASQINATDISHMDTFKNSPDGVSRLFDALELARRVDVAMTALVNVLTMLEEIQLGIEQKGTLSDAIKVLDSADRAIYLHHHSIDEEHVQAAWPVRAQGKFSEIRTMLDKQLTAAIAALKGDKGISAIKERMIELLTKPSPAHVAMEEGIELAISGKKKHVIIDDLSEAERSVVQLGMDKVSLDAELIADAENDDVKLYQCIAKAAKFYRTAIETTSAMAQVQKTLQTMMVANGALSPQELQTTLNQVRVLQLALEAVMRTKVFVKQPIIEYVIKPHVERLKTEMYSAHIVVGDNRLKAAELIAPKCPGIHIKLKQHKFSGGFFCGGTTIAKDIKSGANMPIGDSLSHVYLKPTRYFPWLGFLSSHTPAPAEGSSVGIYARVLSKKPAEPGPTVR